MSAALDVTPLKDRLAHLRRDHITHGYASAHLNEPRREIQVALDNITDLEQSAADLRLARVSNQWSGWYGEIWLILSLDVPRGIHGRPDTTDGGRVMTETTTRPLPAQRDTEPALPTTPRSLVDATVRGSSRRKRYWELHDDGKWWDTFGNPREGRELRDVEILRVAPDPEGSAA